MGLTKPYRILHPHGEKSDVNLIDCVNVTRTPLVRKQILERKFHRVFSKVKKRFVTVEKKFFYSDFDRHQYFLVKLPSDRNNLKEAEAELKQFLRDIPDFISPSEKQYATVAFGLEELREKLLAHDAKLNEKELRKVKIFLAKKHEAALRKMRGNLRLEQVTKDKLIFQARRGNEKMKVSIPVALVKTLTGKNKTAAAKGKAAAIHTLKQFAGQLRDHQTINANEAAFRNMLKLLPKGNKLPKDAQADLEEIFNWAVGKKDDALEDKLFEIRFDTKLEKDWSKNRNEGDIGRLWKLLEELPDSNVEGNTALDEIDLDAATGGGTFDPDTHDIAIGDEELSSPKRFPDVVRHEVGHAVHEMNEKLVNGWLKNVFGWQQFDPTDRNIDQWVTLMNGWNGVSPKEKKEVRRIIKASLGKGGSWIRPQHKPRLARRHVWHSKNFGPRLAVQQTKSNWYSSNNTWYRSNGKAFFLNYWYGTLSVVNEKTLDFINTKMPDQYAAMSPLEFFAELYALYFSHDERKRSKLDRHVILWMARNIGKADGAAASRRKGARKFPKDGSRGG